MEPSSGIEAVRKLTQIGYQFTVNGEIIKAKYTGQGNLDPVQVRPLLASVKAHKAEVIDYLVRKPQEHVTCFECGHFHPAVRSPNVRQAWGHCHKRNKGRYGVAKTCEAILYPGDLEAG
jgi:uroporphyrinogen-III decarboxylase